MGGNASQCYKERRVYMAQEREELCRVCSPPNSSSLSHRVMPDWLGGFLCLWDQVDVHIALESQESA